MVVSSRSFVPWVMLFVLAPVSGLSGQDLFISVVDATAIPEAEITVFVQMTSDGVVEDYQFDVCNDDAVEAIEVNFGRDLDDVNFTFHAVDISADGFSVDAVIGLGEDISGTEVEAYEVQYSVGSDTGVSDLTFCGDLLELSATVDGVVIAPTGGTGTIDIVEPGPDFLRGDANGDGFVTHLLDATFLLAWRLGSQTEPPCLDAADADNDGVSHIVDASWIMAAKYGDIVIDVPEPGEVVCGPDPEAGDLGCVEVPGCPGGEDPLDQEPNEEYELHMEVASATPGGVEPVDVLLTSDGEVLSAFVFSICFDEDQLSTEDGNVIYGDDAADFLDFAWFELIDISDGRIDFMAGTRHSGDVPYLQSGEDLSLYTVFFEVDDDFLGFADVEFCGEESDGFDALMVTEGSEAVIPTTEDGGVEVSQAADFVRGDADGDGEVNGILDALVLLLWGFQNGDPPTCMDAADVDDSGDVFPILDALFVLEYAFTNGQSPPDPGPTECGADPTDDDVECEEASDGC